MRMRRGVALAAVALATALIAPSTAHAADGITGVLYTPLSWNKTSVTWVTSPNEARYDVFVAGAKVASVDNNGPWIDVEIPGLFGPADDIAVQPVSATGVAGGKVQASYIKVRYVYIPGLLHFAAGSSKLDVTAQQLIGKFVAIYLKHGFTDVKARGHDAGPVGAPGAYAMGQQRAAAALALITASVPATTQGESWGNSLAIAPNDTAAGRAANRRVALLLR